MKRWTAAAALALASCSGGGEDDSGNAAGNGSAAAAPANASGQEPAGGAGTRPRLQAGQWEVTLEFLGMEVPNMRRKTPKQAPLPPRTMRICVTAERAARHGPGAILGDVDSKAGRTRCSRAEDPLPSERIRSTVQCDLPRGGSIRVDSEGRYSATTIEVEQQAQAVLPGGTLISNSRLTGRRVGDCPR
jgi:hypothetical protein